METIQFATYKQIRKSEINTAIDKLTALLKEIQSPKSKAKERKSTMEINLSINQIMALTTARGEGKYPKLYVADFGGPLELPGQSFDEIKDKLIGASLSEYQNVNKFIPVGSKVLVNHETVLRVRKTSGEIVFYDDQILDGLNAKMLSEYEKQVEIEKNKPRELNWDGAKLIIDKFAEWQKERTDKNANEFTRKFGTLDDKLVTNGILVLINIVLSLILIIMIGILLYRL